jgi:hypothetical protein
MYGPTGIFGADLTPFSLKMLAAMRRPVVLGNARTGELVCRALDFSSLTWDTGMLTQGGQGDFSPGPLGLPMA